MRHKHTHLGKDGARNGLLRGLASQTRLVVAATAAAAAGAVAGVPGPRLQHVERGAPGAQLELRQRRGRLLLLLLLLGRVVAATAGAAQRADHAPHKAAYAAATAVHATAGGRGVGQNLWGLSGLRHLLLLVMESQGRRWRQQRAVGVVRCGAVGLQTTTNVVAVCGRGGDDAGGELREGVARLSRGDDAGVVVVGGILCGSRQGLTQGVNSAR